MKKITLLIATLVACGAFTALDVQAQQRSRPARGTNQMAMPCMMNSEQRVKALTELLTLTDEQQTKLKALFDEQTESISKLSSLTAEERMTEMKKIRTESDTKIKEILTEEQYKTYSTSNLGRGGNRGPQQQLTVAQRVKALTKVATLTDEQKTKLTELLIAQEKARKELNTSLKDKTQSKQREAVQKLRTEQAAKVKELLGDDVYAQYQKIALSASSRAQRGGMMTPAQQVERLSTQLTLTDDQKTKLTTYFEEQQKAMQEQREKLQSLSSSERQETMKTTRTEQETKLKEILGEDLYKEYTKLMKTNRRGGRDGGSNGRPQRRSN